MKAKYQTIKGVKFKVVPEEVALTCIGCVFSSHKDLFRYYCCRAGCGRGTILKLPKTKKYSYIYTTAINDKSCDYIEVARIYKAERLRYYHQDLYAIETGQEEPSLIRVRPNYPSVHTDSQWFKLGEDNA